MASETTQNQSENTETESNTTNETTSDEHEDNVRADTTDQSPNDRAVVPADAYKPNTNTQSGDDKQGTRGAMRDHIDTSAGSTALSRTDAWVQEHSREPHNDGRSHTRTYFDHREVNEKYPGGQQHRDHENKRSWATLAKWQDGVQSDKSRASQNWWADKQRWIDTFTNRMAATQHHQQRCEYIMKEIDLTNYKPDRIPVELLIIGIISLLIDNEITDFENRALKRGHTETLLKDLDASVSDYINVRSKLKERDADLLFGDQQDE
jgi:hypothetical protein